MVITSTDLFEATLISLTNGFGYNVKETTFLSTSSTESVPLANELKVDQYVQAKFPNVAPVPGVCVLSTSNQVASGPALVLARISASLLPPT